MSNRNFYTTHIPMTIRHGWIHSLLVAKVNIKTPNYPPRLLNFVKLSNRMAFWGYLRQKRGSFGDNMYQKLEGICEGGAPQG